MDLRGMYSRYLARREFLGTWPQLTAAQPSPVRRNFTRDLHKTTFRRNPLEYGGIMIRGTDGQED